MCYIQIDSIKRDLHHCLAGQCRREDPISVLMKFWFICVGYLECDVLPTTTDGFEFPMDTSKSNLDIVGRGGMHVCVFVLRVCLWECSGLSESFNKLITGLIKKADIYSKAQRSRSGAWWDYDGEMHFFLYNCSCPKKEGQLQVGGKWKIKTSN